MAGRGFRYGRRSDTVKIPDFPRQWEGTIREIHHMNMALKVDKHLFPCNLDMYNYIVVNFRKHDKVKITLTPWGQIKTIQKVEGPNNEK